MNTEYGEDKPRSIEQILNHLNILKNVVNNEIELLDIEENNDSEDEMLILRPIEEDP